MDHQIMVLLELNLNIVRLNNLNGSEGKSCSSHKSVIASLVSVNGASMHHFSCMFLAGIVCEIKVFSKLRFKFRDSG